MKARPAGDGVQSVAGRNNRFSGCENEPPLYVARLIALYVTTFCVSGFEPQSDGLR